MASRWFKTWLCLHVILMSAVRGYQEVDELPKACGSVGKTVISCKAGHSLHVHKLSMTLSVRRHVRHLLLASRKSPCTCKYLHLVRRVKHHRIMVWTNWQCNWSHFKACGYVAKAALKLRKKNLVLVGGLLVYWHSHRRSWAIKHHMHEVWDRVKTAHHATTRQKLYRGLLNDVERLLLAKEVTTSKDLEALMLKGGLRRKRSEFDMARELDKFKELNEIQFHVSADQGHSITIEPHSSSDGTHLLKTTKDCEGADDHLPLNVSRDFKFSDDVKRRWPSSTNQNTESNDDIKGGSQNPTNQNTVSNDDVKGGSQNPTNLSTVSNYDVKERRPSPNNHSTVSSDDVQDIHSYEKHIVAKSNELSKLVKGSKCRGVNSSNSDYAADAPRTRSKRRGARGRSYGRRPAPRRNYYVRTTHRRRHKPKPKPKPKVSRRITRKGKPTYYLLPYQVFLGGGFFSLFDSFGIKSMQTRLKALEQSSEHEDIEEVKSSLVKELDKDLNSSKPGSADLLTKAMLDVDEEAVKAKDDSVYDDEKEEEGHTTVAAVQAVHIAQKSDPAWDHRIKSFVVFFVGIVGVICVIISLLVVSLKSKTHFEPDIPYSKTTRSHNKPFGHGPGAERNDDLWRPEDDPLVQRKLSRLQRDEEIMAATHPTIPIYEGVEPDLQPEASPTAAKEEAAVLIAMKGPSILDIESQQLTPPSTKSEQPNQPPTDNLQPSLPPTDHQQSISPPTDHQQPIQSPTDNKQSMSPQTDTKPSHAPAVVPLLGGRHIHVDFSMPQDSEVVEPDPFKKETPPNDSNNKPAKLVSFLDSIHNETDGAIRSDHRNSKDMSSSNKNNDGGNPQQSHTGYRRPDISAGPKINRQWHKFVDSFNNYRYNTNDVTSNNDVLYNTMREDTSHNKQQYSSSIGPKPRSRHDNTGNSKQALKSRDSYPWNVRFSPTQSMFGVDNESFIHDNDHIKEEPPSSARQSATSSRIHLTEERIPRENSVKQGIFTYDVKYRRNSLNMKRASGLAVRKFLLETATSTRVPEHQLFDANNNAGPNKRNSSRGKGEKGGKEGKEGKEGKGGKEGKEGKEGKGGKGRHELKEGKGMEAADSIDDVDSIPDEEMASADGEGNPKKDKDKEKSKSPKKKATPQIAPIEPSSKPNKKPNKKDASKTDKEQPIESFEPSSKPNKKPNKKDASKTDKEQPIESFEPSSKPNKKPNKKDASKADKEQPIESFEPSSKPNKKPNKKDASKADKEQPIESFEPPSRPNRKPNKKDASKADKEEPPTEPSPKPGNKANKKDASKDKTKTDPLANPRDKPTPGPSTTSGKRKMYTNDKKKRDPSEAPEAKNSKRTSSLLKKRDARLRREGNSDSITPNFDDGVVAIITDDVSVPDTVLDKDDLPLSRYTSLGVVLNSQDFPKRSVHVSKPMANALKHRPVLTPLPPEKDEEQGTTYFTDSQSGAPVTFDGLMPNRGPFPATTGVRAGQVPPKPHQGVVWPLGWAAKPPFAAPGYARVGAKQPIGTVQVERIPSKPSRAVINGKSTVLPTWVSPLYRTYGIGGPYGPNGPFFEPPTLGGTRAVDLPLPAVKPQRQLCAFSRWLRGRRKRKVTGVDMDEQLRRVEEKLALVRRIVREDKDKTQTLSFVETNLSSLLDNISRPVVPL